MFGEALETALGAAPSVIAVFSMLAAVGAGLAAHGSYRLAMQLRDEQKSDETFVVGQFHHPELVNMSHAACVIETTIFNKSRRKAAITAIRLLDSKGHELPAQWSDSIDAFGNPQGEAEMIGVVDAARLFIRHRHGAPILEAVAEIHHTFPGSPLRVAYEMPPGWDAWWVGGKAPLAT
jgi:hypothetical protein